MIAVAESLLEHLSSLLGFRKRIAATSLGYFYVIMASDLATSLRLVILHATSSTPKVLESVLFLACALDIGTVTSFPDHADAVGWAFRECLWHWARATGMTRQSLVQFTEMCNLRFGEYATAFGKSSGDSLALGGLASERITGHRDAFVCLPCLEQFMDLLSLPQRLAQGLTVTTPYWQDRLHRPYHLMFRAATHPMTILRAKELVQEDRDAARRAGESELATQLDGICQGLEKLQ